MLYIIKGSNRKPTAEFVVLPSSIYLLKVSSSTVCSLSSLPKIKPYKCKHVITSKVFKNEIYAYLYMLLAENQQTFNVSTLRNILHLTDIFSQINSNSL